MGMLMLLLLVSSTLPKDYAVDTVDEAVYRQQLAVHPRSSAPDSVIVTPTVVDKIPTSQAMHWLVSLPAYRNDDARSIRVAYVHDDKTGGVFLDEISLLEHGRSGDVEIRRDGGSRANMRTLELPRVVRIPTDSISALVGLTSTCPIGFKQWVSRRSFEIEICGAVVRASRLASGDYQLKYLGVDGSRPAP